MGLFKKKTVQEQIEIESLLPDKETVTRLKKQLTAVQTARSKMDDRLAEIEAEVKAAIEAEQTFTTEGKGIDGALTAINDFLKKKKEQPDPELLAEEIKYLNQWWSQYSVPILNQIYGEMKALFNLQQDRVTQLEDTFETAINTAEIDEVYSVLTADCSELFKQFSAIARVKDAVTDKETFNTVNLKLPERNSLNHKQAVAASQGRSAALHQSRLQEATDTQAKADGRELSVNPWLQGRKAV